MEKKRPLTQFEVSRSIIESKSKDLTPMEKLVLLCIANRFSYKPSIGFPEDLVSYESQESIAECANTTRSTVNRAIKALVSNGYIEIVKRSDGMKTYNVYIWRGGIKINKDKTVDKPKQVVYDPMYEDWDDDLPPF